MRFVILCIDLNEVNIPVQVAKEIQGEVVESKRVGEE